MVDFDRVQAEDYFDESEVEWGVEHAMCVIYLGCVFCLN